MSDFKGLLEDIDRGIAGENVGIPIIFKKLSGVVNGIQKSLYTLIGGNSGCLGYGTKIIMYDGSIKEVQDIKVGDQLMGPDSKPRNVLSLARGVEQMYWIRQDKGLDYRVNENHILSLKKKEVIYSKETIPDQLHLPKNKRKRIFTNIGQKETLKNETVLNVLKNNYHNKGYKGYKTGVDFNEKTIILDPYFLGLWLGDGTSKKPQVTNVDKEIVDYLFKYASENQLICKVDKSGITYDFSSDKRLIEYSGSFFNVLRSWNFVKEASEFYNIKAEYISRATKTDKIVNGSKWKWDIKTNKLSVALSRYCLLGNKHIPNEFKYNSREVRLNVLAGLIDSDGHFSKGGYSITQKNKQLAEDITYLSRSLGYYTSLIPKIAKMKRSDGSIYQCRVYKISIYGKNLEDLPIKVLRKKVVRKSIIFDSVITQIKIEKDIVDNYYGFQLDGDHLFLLEDFTVTHNTGKTAYVDLAYVLGVYDWWYANKDKTNIKIKIIYRSMERNKRYKLAKWLCLKLYMDHGIIIDTKTLLGWQGKKFELEPSLIELIKGYQTYFDNMLSSGVVEIIDGAENPTGIYKHINAHAMNNGKYEAINEYSKRYIPNDPNLYTIIIIDHIGKCKSEINGGKHLTKKETTDKLSEYMGLVRDSFGFIPVVISQFNRAIGNIERFKNKDVSPEPDDFKDSGNIYEDSDVCLALFNPFKLKVNDFLGYEIPKFVSSSGENRFRSVSVLKNTYGADDIIIGMNFLGECGHFREIAIAEKFAENPKWYKLCAEYSSLK